MNCPTCGREVKGLACEPCTNKRAYEVIRASQRNYLQDARKDRVRFFAVRRAMAGGETQPWHLALFGDRTHSYCGEEFLRPGYQNRTHLTWKYTQERPREVCEKCLWNLRWLEQAEAVPEKES